ncbi:hypothetical protein KEM52_006195, partial [Ascosphaera acerosa]
ECFEYSTASHVARQQQGSYDHDHDHDHDILALTDCDGTRSGGGSGGSSASSAARQCRKSHYFSDHCRSPPQHSHSRASSNVSKQSWTSITSVGSSLLRRWSSARSSSHGRGRGHGHALGHGLGHGYSYGYGYGGSYGSGYGPLPSPTEISEQIDRIPTVSRVYSPPGGGYIGAGGFGQPPQLSLPPASSSPPPPPPTRVGLTRARTSPTFQSVYPEAAAERLAYFRHPHQPRAVRARSYTDPPPARAMPAADELFIEHPRSLTPAPTQVYAHSRVPSQAQPPPQAQPDARRHGRSHSRHPSQSVEGSSNRHRSRSAHVRTQSRPRYYEALNSKPSQTGQPGQPQQPPAHSQPGTTARPPSLPVAVGSTISSHSGSGASRSSGGSSEGRPSRSSSRPPASSGHSASRALSQAPGYRLYGLRAVTNPEKQGGPSALPSYGGPAVPVSQSKGHSRHVSQSVVQNVKQAERQQPVQDKPTQSVSQAAPQVPLSQPSSHAQQQQAPPTTSHKSRPPTGIWTSQAPPTHAQTAIPAVPSLAATALPVGLVPGSGDKKAAEGASKQVKPTPSHAQGYVPKTTTMTTREHQAAHGPPARFSYQPNMSISMSGPYEGFKPQLADRPSGPTVASAAMAAAAPTPAPAGAPTIAAAITAPAATYAELASDRLAASSPPSSSSSSSSPSRPSTAPGQQQQQQQQQGRNTGGINFSMPMRSTTGSQSGRSSAASSVHQTERRASPPVLADLAHLRQEDLKVAVLSPVAETAFSKGDTDGSEESAARGQGQGQGQGPATAPSSGAGMSGASPPPRPLALRKSSEECPLASPPRSIHSAASSVSGGRRRASDAAAGFAPAKPASTSTTPPAQAKAAAAAAQSVGKVFIICCNCKRFHDLPPPALEI